MSRQSPDVVTLTASLRRLLRAGARPATMAKEDELLVLMTPGASSTIDDGERWAAAAAFEVELREAILSAFGPRAEGVLALFGLAAGTKGGSLGDRRVWASQALGVSERTIMRRETAIIEELAAELCVRRAVRELRELSAD